MSDTEKTVPLTKEKVKKPRSEKQLEAFKIASLKRAENIEKKKLEKKIEASKILLEHDISIKQKLPKTEKELVKDDDVEEDSDSSESEEEKLEMIQNSKQKNKKVKPDKIKTKKKKITKVVYVEHASSSDESDSDSSSEESIKHIKQRNFVTQRNKKSLVKVHKESPQPQPTQPRKYVNYFAD